MSDQAPPRPPRNADWGTRLDRAMLFTFGVDDAQRLDWWGRCGESYDEADPDVQNMVDDAEELAARYDDNPLAAHVLAYPGDLDADIVAYWRPILIAQGYTEGD
jgi:hypothetical protein